MQTSDENNYSKRSYGLFRSKSSLIMTSAQDFSQILIFGSVPGSVPGQKCPPDQNRGYKRPDQNRPVFEKQERVRAQLNKGFPLNPTVGAAKCWKSKVATPPTKCIYLRTSRKIKSQRNICKKYLQEKFKIFISRCIGRF